MIYETTRLSSLSLPDEPLPILYSENGSKITIVTGGCYIQRPYQPCTNKVVDDFLNLEWWFQHDLDESDEDLDSNPFVGIDGIWFNLEYEQINAGTPAAKEYGEYILYVSKTFDAGECLETEKIKLGLITLKLGEGEDISSWVARANHVLLG